MTGGARREDFRGYYLPGRNRFAIGSGGGLYPSIDLLYSSRCRSNRCFSKSCHPTRGRSIAAITNIACGCQSGAFFRSGHSWILTFSIGDTLLFSEVR